MRPHGRVQRIKVRERKGIVTERRKRKASSGCNFSYEEANMAVARHISKTGHKDAWAT